MPTQTKTLDTLQLRSILAHAPTPSTAVSAVVDDQPVGMAVGSFVGLSLEPPLVGVSIQKTSSTWSLLRTANQIGISVLTENHAPVVRQLAGPKDKRFANIGWRKNGEAVLLEDSAAHLTTQLIDEIDTGDHILALLEVKEAEEFIAGLPLVFHGSQFTSVRG
ncbi:Conserved protein of DIM6/NTAB family [Corynebacterium camporealensis]|uniref:flavin reductase family protein n=1 Tax=Corynebacterium camporealensis TaxID=161896 RepID=UPI000CF8C88B|nr:flavin reductase family protein [Corynebacterium camporealensis]AVH87340.1 Conserved protein of DIM6/NTAB family [Corynebacterium camporealensis]